MTSYDEETIARALRRLPAVPAGWVRAAQELPAAQRELDGIVERAERDAAYRAAILADLEKALSATGVEPRQSAVEHLRRRLQAWRNQVGAQMAVPNPDYDPKRAGERPAPKRG